MYKIRCVKGTVPGLDGVGKRLFNGWWGVGAGGAAVAVVSFTPLLPLPFLVILVC